MTSDRTTTVRALIELAAPLETIAGRLGQLPWDFEGKPVELRSEHLERILCDFLNGAFAAAEVERWANLVECREDIDFEAGRKQWIGEVVHELANPVLTQALDRERARALLAGAPMPRRRQ
jgi:hypothetical protein